MSQMIPFESSNNVPAHLTQMFGAQNSDLANGVSIGGYPTISYKGKVWHLVEGDNRQLVTKPGEDEPASSLEVVILKANPHLSKVYYANGYEEGANVKPTCYSNNGVGPAADSQEPQCKTCAACPHNAWGSRISENGAKGKACADSRRLAVAPAGDLERPMLLRVPAGTLKDLVAYADMLNRRKAPYQAVVTKIAFDHTVAHQKFTFKATRWLSQEEAATVQDVLQRDIINQITGIDEARVPEHDAPAVAAPAPAPKAAAPKPAAKASAFVATPEEVEDAIAPAPAPKAAAPKAEAPAPKATKKPDTSALLAEADASLDAALAALDD